MVVGESLGLGQRHLLHFPEERGNKRDGRGRGGKTDNKNNDKKKKKGKKRRRNRGGAAASSASTALVSAAVSAARGPSVSGTSLSTSLTTMTIGCTKSWRRAGARKRRNKRMKKWNSFRPSLSWITWPGWRRPLAVPAPPRAHAHGRGRVTLKRRRRWVQKSGERASSGRGATALRGAACPRCPPKCAMTGPRPAATPAASRRSGGSVTKNGSLGAGTAPDPAVGVSPGPSTSSWPLGRASVLLWRRA